MRLLAPLATLAIALVAAGAGCGSDEKPQTVVALAGQTVPTARLQSIVAGLCEAARQAPTDVDAARRTFFGQSHEGLHLLARGLEEDGDRATSATLLQAKQKVEADFLTPPPGSQVADDLRQLAEVTRTGLDGFDVPAAPCPPA